MRLLRLFLFLAVAGLMGGRTAAQEANFLGVRVGDLTKEEAQELGWEAPRGAKVIHPVPGGPAAGAGLQQGDIILSLDGVEIANYRHFLSQLHTKTPGAEIKLGVLRKGKESAVNIKLVTSAEALAELGRTIAREPNSIVARLSRSELLFRLNRPLEAAIDCEQILRLSPENGWGFYCRARVSIAREKPDAALDDLNVAVLKLPRSERPLVTRAALYAKKKDYDRAIEDLNRALALDERSVVALTSRGEAYLAKALTARAIEDFNAALAIDKNDGRAKKGLEAAEAKRKELVVPEIPPPGIGPIPVSPIQAPPAVSREAASSQKKQELIAIDPKLKAEVDQLRSKKEFKQALELIDKALAQSPNHAGLHNLRGSVLQFSGDFATAITEYDKAASMQPQFVDAQANRINARLALRKTADAMKASEEFLQQNPDLALPYDLRGKARMQANSLAEAKADFERAIEKDPKLAPAWVDRGQIYLAGKEYEKALADFSHAIELDPKSDSAYGMRGKTYLVQRNVKPAISDFRKALSINGANWVAFTSLQGLQMAKALEQLGQLKKDGS